MTTPRRRRREKEVRADNILEAAEQVFFEKGFAKTSMDEIARKADASRALLYVYFTDKAAIMRAIMLRAAHSLVARLEEAFDAGDTGLDQLEGFGQAYYDFSIEQSDYFNVLTDLNTFPLPKEHCSVLAEVKQCNARINRLIVSAMENGLKDGSLCPERIPEPVLTACFLEGALHGIIMQTRGVRMGEFHYPDDTTLIRYTIKMLSQSLKK